MNKFIWKFLFAMKLKSLSKQQFSWCWYVAGSWVEMFDEICQESPFSCALEEVDSWSYCI